MLLQSNPAMQRVIYISTFNSRSLWYRIIAMHKSRCEYETINYYQHNFMCYLPYSIFGQNLGVFLWSRSIMLGSVEAESEHPRLTNRDIIF